MVSLPSHDGDVLALYAIDEVAPIKLTQTVESGNVPTVHPLRYGGETGDVYNSFVFGIAPPGAVRFSLAASGPTAGGEIVNGTFVVAMTAKDLAPNALDWAFLSADQQVVAEGIGIRD